MLFLGLPEMPVQMTEMLPAYAVVQAANHAGFVGNFGFCTIADDSGSISGGVDITRPFYDLIPQRIQKALKDSQRLGVSVLEYSDEAWLERWEKSFSIKILLNPEHGELRRYYNSQFIGFTPEEGYQGKDRMDVLIEGKAPDGSPISARANIYVQFVSKDIRNRLLGKNGKVDGYIKRYCPVPAIFWKIDTKPAISTLGGRRSAAVLNGAGQNLSFFNFTGYALAGYFPTPSSSDTPYYPNDPLALFTLLKTKLNRTVLIG